MKNSKYIVLITLFLFYIQMPLMAQESTCEPNAENRIRIVDENLPNAYTCYMEMRRGWFSKKLGTGMLIHPRVVLTAGHNTAFYMFSKSFPFVASSVQNATMYFGSIDKDNYLVKQSVRLKTGKTKFFNSAYWVNGHISRDFSIIILPDDSVYNAVGGHYVLKPVKTTEDIEGPIHLTGSPGNEAVHEIWTEESQNFKISSSKLSYDLFTAPRNSGSPVWTLNNEGQYQVVGVHSRKDNSCNASVLINDETYNQIVEWCKQAGIELK